MSTWKFAFAFLAASISANSTMAWAAAEIQNQKTLNKYFRDQVIMDGLTMNQAYKKHAGVLDPSSQAAMEAWLKNYGQEKYPAPQVQTSGESNGGKDNSQIKLISTFQGQAYTFIADEKYPDRITINGQNFSLVEAQNLQFVIQKLSGKDSKLKPLAQQLSTAPVTNPSGQGELSTAEFIRLPNTKKMEYLMLLREVVEAAGEVKHLVDRTVSQNESTENSYVSLFILPAAFAATQSLAGRACLVAGNISIYELSNKRMKCSPSPQSSDNGAFDQMKSFNSQCASGSDTACNPLVYGFNSQGKPHCLLSSDQPAFTLNATKTCNERSPLAKVVATDEAGKAQQELQRKKDMVRILESYYLNKNPGKQGAIKDCFSEDKSAIKESCKSLFDEQRQAFLDFRNDALAICPTIEKSMTDQKSACDALRQRALELALFTEDIKNPIVVDPFDGNKADCKGIGEWDAKANKCMCDKDREAEKTLTGYICIFPVKDHGAITSKPLKEDKCDKDGNGKKDNSFSCNKGLWIGIGIAALLAFFLLRGHKKPKAPASEGGTGNNNGNNGGVRTTTTLGNGVH